MRRRPDLANNQASNFFKARDGDSDTASMADAIDDLARPCPTPAPPTRACWCKFKRHSDHEKTAYLHGLAGDLAASEQGEAGLIASDVIRAVPRAIQHVLTGDAPAT